MGHCALGDLLPGGLTRVPQVGACDRELLQRVGSALIDVCRRIEQFRQLELPGPCILAERDDVLDRVPVLAFDAVHERETGLEIVECLRVQVGARGVDGEVSGNVVSFGYESLQAFRCRIEARIELRCGVHGSQRALKPTLQSLVAEGRQGDIDVVAECLGVPQANQCGSDLGFLIVPDCGCVDFIDLEAQHVAVPLEASNVRTDGGELLLDGLVRRPRSVIRSLRVATSRRETPVEERTYACGRRDRELVVLSDDRHVRPDRINEGGDRGGGIVDVGP